MRATQDSNLQPLLMQSAIGEQRATIAPAALVVRPGGIVLEETLHIMAVWEDVGAGDS